MIPEDRVSYRSLQAIVLGVDSNLQFDDFTAWTIKYRLEDVACDMVGFYSNFKIINSNYSYFPTLGDEVTITRGPRMNAKGYVSRIFLDKDETILYEILDLVGAVNDSMNNMSIDGQDTLSAEFPSVQALRKHYEKRLYLVRPKYLEPTGNSFTQLE